MTREQIEAKWQALSARERDAWVGTEIMGITPEYDERFGLDGWKTGEDTWSSSVPEYTKFSNTWRVLRILRERWLVNMADCGSFGWRIDLLSDSEERMDIGGINALELPEAICLAALIAKLTEVA